MDSSDSSPDESYNIADRRNQRPLRRAQSMATLPSQRGRPLLGNTYDNTTDPEAEQLAEHYKVMVYRLVKVYESASNRRDAKGSTVLSRYDHFVLRIGDEVFPLLQDIVDWHQYGDNTDAESYDSHIISKIFLAYGLLRGFELAADEKLGNRAPPPTPPTQPCRRKLLRPPPPRATDRGLCMGKKATNEVSFKASLPRKNAHTVLRPDHIPGGGRSWSMGQSGCRT
ncbi:MAG: hypothetical protein M1839_005835 [Geoglossum umbratile]|nr:MAG: hypothetical protein M1839_005835 [Geoglossum umbratile]